MEFSLTETRHPAGSGGGARLEVLVVEGRCLAGIREVMGQDLVELPR